MQSQHNTAIPSASRSEEATPQGIIVPLELPDLCILGQHWCADGSLEVSVRSTNEQATCPHCGRVSVKVHDTRIRSKRDLPLRAHPVRLLLYKWRFSCLSCRRSFTEPDRACGYRRRSTQRWRETMGLQGCLRPVSHVATEMGVGPRFVQDCVHEFVQQRFAEDGRSLDETAPLATPRFLGIDEFARRKGHCYDTILCDLEHRCVLEVAAERTSEAVVRLLERLSDPEGVEAVSMDMSVTFREAVRLVLPRARVVADHFHVIQHVGKAFAKVLRRVAATREGKSALKGKRRLFLQARERLSLEQEQERASLAAAFPELATAWLLKEALREWYATTTSASAARELEVWVALVERFGSQELREALSAFRNWREEILAFFDFLPTRLSNGFVEGKNNRTKALMRQAYGYRNRLHLRLRILAEVS